MIDQIPHVSLRLSTSQLQHATSLSKQLLRGHTIAVVSPPRYQSWPFAGEIAAQMRAADVLNWRLVEIELEKYAFHPAPLPAIYNKILVDLGLDTTVESSDQLLQTLSSTQNDWVRCIIIFRMIDAIPKAPQMELATVIRSLGNHHKICQSIRPILTGGIELIGLTKHNDLGVSPLNGATVVELEPLTVKEINEVFLWPVGYAIDDALRWQSASLIHHYTGGHPGLVSLMAERLSGDRRFRAWNMVDAETCIHEAASSHEIMEHPFIIRTLQPLKMSLPLFQAAVATLAESTHKIDPLHARILRLTGAVVAVGAVLRFNGDILRRAATAAFGPSAIPDIIVAASGTETALTFNIADGVRPVQTVPQALQQLGHTLVNYYGFEYVHVFVADENERTLQGCLVICSMSGCETTPVDASKTKVSYFNPTSLVGLAASEMNAIWSEDAEHDSRRDIELWKQVGSPTGAVLNLPITPDGKELIGVFGVGAPSAKTLENAASDLRKIARDIAPVIKQLKRTLLREQLIDDAQEYGRCYTQRDVALLLCQSLQRALRSRTVAVYRRARQTWDLLSHSGREIGSDPAIKEMVLGHLEHVSSTPSQVCYRTLSESKPVIYCSVATLFHSQPEFASSGGAAVSSDFAVIVINETPFDSPEHHIRHTFDSVATAAQLAVPSLRQVTQREYAMLQYLYGEALHEIGTPLFNVNLSCTMLRTTLEELQADERAKGQVQNVLNDVSIALHRIRECRNELRAVLNHTKDGASTHNFRTDVLEAFEKAGIRIELVGVDEIPPVRGHPIVWRLCLRNLISNAREASPADTLISVLVSIDDDSIRLVVQDNGHGLQKVSPDKDYEQGLFKKDARDNQPRGFGLAFCKMMLDHHGGTFSLADRRDTRGAEATMTIPRFH